MNTLQILDISTKVILIVIGLGVFALPVKAEEKIWYCEMTGLAKTNLEGAKTFKLQKFKFKETNTEVIFGSGGYFDNARLRINIRISETLFDASNIDSSAQLSFDDGKFHFTVASYDDATAISARCDDF